MEIKVITAPEKYEYQKGDFIIFLAGGIQKCKEWQNIVISKILSFSKTLNIDFSYKRLVVANPRRENFPIHDSSAAEEQITWEFDMLSKMDYFFMYFDGPTESDQPIRFYELGRHLSKIEERFRNDWVNRCCICVNNDFKRKQDVIIQTKLASKNKIVTNIISNENLDIDFNNIVMMVFNGILNLV